MINNGTRGSSELQKHTLAQFDSLVRKGELYWESNEPRYVRSGGFDLEFRISAPVKKKPVLAPNDPGRKKDSHAFSDDDPEFIIQDLSKTHRLILNKFSILRAQYIIHTIDFEPQANPLGLADFEAALTVLGELEDPHVVIYNCGEPSGSSLGHKHLQVFPRTRYESEEKRNIIDYVDSVADGARKLAEIPYQHYVSGLCASNAISSASTTKEFQTTYEELLQHARKENPEVAAHNVVMTQNWVMVIPRRVSRDGVMAANAATMVGMIWVPSEEAFQTWVENGPLEVLCRFGVKT